MCSLYHNIRLLKSLKLLKTSDFSSAGRIVPCLSKYSVPPPPPRTFCNRQHIRVKVILQNHIPFLIYQTIIPDAHNNSRKIITSHIRIINTTIIQCNNITERIKMIQIMETGNQWPEYLAGLFPDNSKAASCQFHLPYTSIRGFQETLSFLCYGHKPPFQGQTVDW